MSFSGDKHWAFQIFFFAAIGLAYLALIIEPLDEEVSGNATEEAQREYEKDKAGFYERLEALRKIEVQISLDGYSEGMKHSLQTRKCALEREMREIVSQIPQKLRTEDMSEYEGYLGSK